MEGYEVAGGCVFMSVLVVAATPPCRSVLVGSTTGVGAGATFDMGLDRSVGCAATGEDDVDVVRYPDAILAKYEPVLPIAALTCV